MVIYYQLFIIKSKLLKYMINITNQNYQAYIFNINNMNYSKCPISEAQYFLQTKNITLKYERQAHKNIFLFIIMEIIYFYSKEISSFLLK